MMVWQSAHENEWATAIESALGENPFTGPADAFSLAEPHTVEPLLVAAGFAHVAFEDVREPVCYGPDAAAALELVRDIRAIRERIARMNSVQAQRVVGQLHEAMTAHEAADGVWFGSRVWIVSARRATKTSLRHRHQSHRHRPTN
jgi:hypothetical protein